MLSAKWVEQCHCIRDRCWFSRISTKHLFLPKLCWYVYTYLSHVAHYFLAPVVFRASPSAISTQGAVVTIAGSSFGTVAANIKAIYGGNALTVTMVQNHVKFSVAIPAGTYYKSLTHMCHVLKTSL